MARTIVFLHPRCLDGGGGEHFLWRTIQCLLNNESKTNDQRTDNAPSNKDKTNTKGSVNETLLDGSDCLHKSDQDNIIIVTSHSKRQTDRYAATIQEQFGIDLTERKGSCMTGQPRNSAVSFIHVPEFLLLQNIPFAQAAFSVLGSFLCSAYVMLVLLARQLWSRTGEDLSKRENMQEIKESHKLLSNDIDNKMILADWSGMPFASVLLSWMFDRCICYVHYPFMRLYEDDCGYERQELLSLYHEEPEIHAKQPFEASINVQNGNASGHRPRGRSKTHRPVLKRFITNDISSMPCDAEYDNDDDEKYGKSLAEHRLRLLRHSTKHNLLPIKGSLLRCLGAVGTAMKVTYKWLLWTAYSRLIGLFDAVGVNSQWTLSKLPKEWRDSQKCILWYPFFHQHTVRKDPGETVLDVSKRGSLCTKEETLGDSADEPSTDSSITSQQQSTVTPFRIISIGQFRPEKRQMAQLQIFHAFLHCISACSCHDLPQCSPLNQTRTASLPTLHIIGSCRQGNHRQDWQRVEQLKKFLIRYPDMQALVQVKVNLSRQQVRDELANCDVLLSTMRCEHFGIGILEGMAAGAIPVVHSSGGPATDIIQDGIDGRLCDCTDSFARCLVQLYQQSNYTEDKTEQSMALSRMKQKAKEKAIQMGSPELFHQKVHELF